MRGVNVWMKQTNKCHKCKLWSIHFSRGITGNDGIRNEQISDTSHDSRFQDKIRTTGLRWWSDTYLYTYIVYFDLYNIVQVFFHSLYLRQTTDTMSLRYQKKREEYVWWRECWRKLYPTEKGEKHLRECSWMQWKETRCNVCMTEDRAEGWISWRRMIYFG